MPWFGCLCVCVFRRIFDDKVRSCSSQVFQLGGVECETSPTTKQPTDSDAGEVFDASASLLMTKSDVWFMSSCSPWWCGM